MRRGDVVLVNFDPTVGREIKKIRPALVVSNNIANQKSSLIAVLPITSKHLDRISRTEVALKQSSFLKKPSKILVDQIRTIDRERIAKILGRVPRETLSKVDERLMIHLSIGIEFE